ncbi:hypothetical protein PR202_gb15433 [Eleusine coracana subsp. coracana]|uniref:Uncharacterized protein n=1 Tax=Eleusine coracana subsp. coracana TaxID=191504 RepID=A0AAV5EXT5_ELECO|nr:hypothetical protein PR202_gb15433 [Eleusine coracana subsp. coracana]
MWSAFRSAPAPPALPRARLPPACAHALPPAGDDEIGVLETTRDQHSARLETTRAYPSASAARVKPRSSGSLERRGPPRKILSSPPPARSARAAAGIFSG